MKVKTQEQYKFQLYLTNLELNKGYLKNFEDLPII